MLRAQPMFWKILPKTLRAQLKIPKTTAKIGEILGKTIFSNSYTCANCLSILKYYKERIITNPNNFCDFILNIYEYKGIIKNQIWKFKFREAKYIGKTFAELMSLKIEMLNLDFDVIIPVPISFRRYLERGYNQSYEISKHIGGLLSKKVYKNIIIKIKNNKRQSDFHGYYVR